MNAVSARMGRKRLLSEYADWTDRIKTGELPAQKPPRPQGIERNVVITQWDWSGPKEYFHDEISVDRRNPVNSNPNGLVYGVHEDSTDFITVLDPTKNSFKQIAIPYGSGHSDGRAGRTARTFALLGQRAGRRLARHGAQLDDGLQGPHLDRRGHARPR